MSDLYCQTSDEDAAMQAQHSFMWRALLDTIDVEVGGKRALDAGCNQGGLLRLLCDEGRIASGYGGEGQRPLRSAGGGAVVPRTMSSVGMIVRRGRRLRPAAPASAS